MKEIWKDIEGYEGLYQISNTGKVRRLKVLKPSKTNGYLYVQLLNKEIKGVSIHRLVANAFIKKRKNKNWVNHKDGNKLNNNVNNLEWCDATHNLNEAYRLGLKVPKRSKENTGSKKILQFDLKGNLIKEWDCIKDVQRELGYSTGNICSCCRGRYKTAYGYIWKYAEESSDIKLQSSKQTQ